MSLVLLIANKDLLIGRLRQGFSVCEQTHVQGVIFRSRPVLPRPTDGCSSLHKINAQVTRNYTGPHA